MTDAATRVCITKSDPGRERKPPRSVNGKEVEKVVQELSLAFMHLNFLFTLAFLIFSSFN